MIRTSELMTQVYCHQDIKEQAFALCVFRDGTIDVGELSRVLSALGRVAPKDTVVLN